MGLQRVGRDLVSGQQQIDINTFADVLINTRSLFYLLRSGLIFYGTMFLYNVCNGDFNDYCSNRFV